MTASGSTSVSKAKTLAKAYIAYWLMIEKDAALVQEARHFHPSQPKFCPECGHSLRVHTGAGCEVESCECGP